MKIQDLTAWEILDSRGRPTVAVQATLDSGVTAAAQVPSGASTGTHEALELRDGDPAHYRGKGVRTAVRNVETEIAAALRGMDAEDQRGIDRTLIGLGKTRLGANATLGASCAVARAVSVARSEPLWLTLAGPRAARMPVPMVNILSGGHHAGHNIELQDFLALPMGFARYSEALHAVVQVHAAAAELIATRGYTLTGVADEGGWGPALGSNEEALELLTRAIERAGYEPGRDVAIAIDVAATHFHHDGEYRLGTENRTLTREGMIALLEDWTRRYPVVSIEDGLAEDDWSGWRDLTAALGGRVQLVGDDFFTTNPERVRRGIRERAANAVLVKMNQIGTLTETFEVADLAREAGWRAVVSARSGETEDSFLADLAIATGAGQIKVGSITRSERLAKYNRLLEIEKRSDLAYGWPPQV